jgi:hypothetical protein
MPEEAHDVAQPGAVRLVSAPEGLPQVVADDRSQKSADILARFYVSSYTSRDVMGQCAIVQLHVTPPVLCEMVVPERAGEASDSPIVV